MIVPTEAASGAFFIALAIGAALVLAASRARVKLRSFSRRWLGIRVYDFGADLVLPPPLHSRSYQIALYLTMKSLPREPAPQKSASVTASAASR